MTKKRVGLDSFWMPFSSNRNFKARPRMLVSASGMFYRDDRGREILDATSGLWCCNAGHCRESIADAVSSQIKTLDFAPTFQMGHPKAFELAERLAGDVFPDGLDRIVFANSGSEAIDSAIKIVLTYQNLRGKGSKSLLIARERAYHGVNLGGSSICGIVNNRRRLANLLAADFLPHTHDLARNRYCRGQPKRGGLEFANALERLIALHGAEKIAAVFIEPVPGSTGVLVPPVGYLPRIREICTANDILLVFDEVITGFGRVGARTASERFGVTPDLLTFAKSVTSGTMPMGGVAVRRDIAQTFLDAAAANTIDFFHGYTFSGHPLAAAAALAAQDLYAAEGLYTRARRLEKYWGDCLFGLRGIRNVLDLRCLGLMGAIELQPRPGRPTARAFAAFVDAFHKEQLLIRTTGDTIALSPPLIVSRQQIDMIVERVGRVLRRLK